MRYRVSFEVIVHNDSDADTVGEVLEDSMEEALRYLSDTIVIDAEGDPEYEGDRNTVSLSGWFNTSRATWNGTLRAYETPFTPDEADHAVVVLTRAYPPDGPVMIDHAVLEVCDGGSCRIDTRDSGDIWRGDRVIEVEWESDGYVSVEPTY